MSSSENKKFDVKAFALDLRSDIEKNRIKLPTLPAISLEALLIVNDAASSMADVARIIAKDTSMAARLVRYANSPLYMGINTVTSVKAAITRIGFDAVKHAILSLAMKDVFTTTYKPIQLRMEELWKHSVAVAARAAMLSGHFHHLNKDEAMLAGLIHDVGIIPILIKSSNYEVLLDKESNLDKVIRVLHPSIGKFILSHWNFDQALVDVAANHHALDRAPPGKDVDYVDIIQVADIISHQLANDRYEDLEVGEIVAFQRVGLDLVEQVKEQIGSGDEEAALSSMLH